MELERLVKSTICTIIGPQSREERDVQVSFARYKGGSVVSLRPHAIHLLALQIAKHDARHLQDGIEITTKNGGEAAHKKLM